MMRPKLFTFCQTLLRKPIIVCSSIGIAIGAMLLLVERSGLLESLELRAYDQMLRLRPQRSMDSRLLIVGVSESDLQQLQMATPSDQILAKAIAQLQKSQPSVIGLDFYRDLPQGSGYKDLLKQFQADNLLGIYRATDRSNDRIPPPPGIPPERLGFNDTSVDSDGVVRRALFFAGEETSFALQAAFMHLEKQGVTPEETPRQPGIMTLGKAVFTPIEPTIGAYRRADTRGHQMLLNYRNAQVAPIVSLSQVLAGKVSKQLIHDRIVLIGNVAVSSKDYFYTPYSAAQTEKHQMSGVEVHGQIVSQILDASAGVRPLMGDWPDRVEVLWIIAWGIISGLLSWRAKQVPPWIFAQLGLAGLPLLLSWQLLNQSIWVPTVAPVVNILLTGAAVMGYRAQTLQRQNQMALTLLGQNTSPTVAQTLWENRHDLIESGQLVGQQATATMLFADLKGFSTIAEVLSPIELMRWLNEYLGDMTEEIHRHEGVVNKFIGDGIFAVFGVPIPRSNEQEIAQDADQAVQCAIGMAQRLDKLNQIWQKRGLGQVQMRIGICTGSVIIGSLGSRDHIEYGVIGDAVNTASRLESCHKDRQPSDCRILITESTQRYLPQQFVVEDWGMLELKGKQQLVNVYRLVLSP
jgi:adenylate cyclase